MWRVLLIFIVLIFSFYFSVTGLTNSKIFPQLLKIRSQQQHCDVEYCSGVTFIKLWHFVVFIQRLSLKAGNTIARDNNKNVSPELGSDLMAGNDTRWCLKQTFSRPIFECLSMTTQVKSCITLSLVSTRNSLRTQRRHIKMNLYFVSSLVCSGVFFFVVFL